MLDQFTWYARIGPSAGWHTCLDLLEHELAGEPAPWAQGERWREVHRSYVDSLGPEAATIGPPDQS